jgi:hypothetical protein
VALGAKHFADVTADHAGRAGNENTHRVPFPEALQAITCAARDRPWLAPC